MGLATSIVFAVLINLFATGIFAFVGFVFPTHKVIGSSYYKIYNIDGLQKAYRLMNVELFRKYLLIAIWGKDQNRKHFFDGTRAGIQKLIYMTKQSEIGHVLALLLITMLCLVMMVKGYWVLIIITMMINIVFNLYPVILQRYHRMRIARLIERSSK